MLYDGRLDLEEWAARGREYVEREADRSVALARYREVLIDRLVQPGHVREDPAGHAVLRTCWAYGGPPRVMSDYAARPRRARARRRRLHDGRPGRARASVSAVRGARRRARAPVPEHQQLARLANEEVPAARVRGALARHVGRYDVVHVTDTRTLLDRRGASGDRSREGAARRLCRTGRCRGRTASAAGSRTSTTSALVRPMLRRSPLLLAQTAHEAELYEELGGARTAIQLLPLPLPPIDTAPESGAFRRSLGARRGRAAPALPRPDQPPQGPRRPA